MRVGTFLCSEQIVVLKMLHDILYPTVQQIAQPVDGIHFHIFVVTQAVKLRAIDVIGGIQIVLGNPLVLHRLPQSVILYHSFTR